MKIGHQAFGKLERDAGGTLSGWHPLLDHLFDVAACFWDIAHCRGPRRALTQAAGRPLTAVDLKRLAALVFLHDIGKANSGFQAKRWRLEDRPPRSWPAPAGHGPEGLMLFSQPLAHLHAPLPLDALDGWGTGLWPLLVASISHHGWPLPASPAAQHTPWQPVIGPQGKVEYDPAATIATIGAALSTHFADALTAPAQPLPTPPAFAHLFAGLVQLADWLGSDTRFFPFTVPGEERALSAPARARKAVQALGLASDHWRAALAAQAPDFQAVFDFPPWPMQAAMADLPAAGPGLTILEAETGSGKTEAALWHFLALFRQGAVDSLYFALPTRVAASQAERRIRRVIARLWPDDPPLCVRALPGYAAADGQEPQVLPHFQVLWPDQPEDTLAHRRWAAEAPKRFLAAPVAVGTIDQALLAVLQQRHAHLRLALLARSLLVVDEVHASDAYMTALLERLLAAHLHHGGQALLLSATLGAVARERYLDLTGRRRNPRADAAAAQTLAAAVAYPARSDVRGIIAVAGSAQCKSVAWATASIIDDPVAIAEVALAEARAGARVLIVRNTVPAAVAVLQALEPQVGNPAWLFQVNGAVTLHHGRFSREDRPLLDAAVEAALGKGRPGGPLIVIGTQTLEQSLDLDADLLLTDLCPMDVLLQRIGRLHRHPGTPRPAICRTARVRVLTPPGDDLSAYLTRARHGLGGESIYTDLRAVEATRRLLTAHPTVTLPADNRVLVEAATHPQALRAIEQALGESWQRVGEKQEGRIGAERGLAHLQAIDFSQAFDEQAPFPHDVKIATRLGLRDRLALFPPGCIGPFGAALRALPIRAHLLPEALDADPVPTALNPSPAGLCFHFGAQAFCYGRYGLERTDDT